MDELLQELAVIDADSQTLRNYTKSLALLRALKAGTVSLDNVTMTDVGWSVAEVLVEPPVEDVAHTPEDDDGEPA